MPRLTHRRSVLLTALVMSTALAVAAQAAPPTGSYPAAIEGLAAYDGQTTCSPTEKAGTVAFRALLTGTYRGTGDLGIVRACAIGGVSEHKEGRAWDWKVNAYDAGQDAQARDLLTWLLATDAQGNEFAMARRIGVMYMIYNRRIWSANQADAGWRPYTGANPHTDHVHFSLSRVGGAKAVSYWGAAPAVPYVPASAPVVAKWQALGGAAGVLGAPQRGEYAVPGGLAQDYANGRILWSSATGAAAVYGATGGRYDALGGPGGPLGLPVADEVDVRNVAGARVALFQGGRVYWSPTTGVGTVQGALAARHLELGGASGPLGLPLDDERAAGPGRRSTLQGGRLVWGPTTGAHAVVGAIGLAWDRNGGASGPLGLPTTEEVAAPGGARVNGFQNGRVYWSAATGAAAVQGAIAQRHLALGGPGGALGLPTEDETATGSGRVSRFVGGRLVWGPTTGTRVVAGAIAVGWERLGAGAGPLGLPTTDERAAPADGRTNAFQGGSVYWSAATGVASLQGAIATRYDDLGGAGALGLPVSDETAVRGGRQSVLQRARVLWGPATGAHAVAGAVAVGYDRAGGPSGQLGLPVDEEVAAGVGRAGAFQGGRVLWSPATGVQSVAGPALAGLDRQGGVTGFLGFPTSGVLRVTPVAEQQLFQGGRVYVMGARAQSLRGALLATYLHLGGPAGPLGVPLSDEYDVPGGKRTDFERGSLQFDSATGVVTQR